MIRIDQPDLTIRRRRHRDLDVAPRLRRLGRHVVRRIRLAIDLDITRRTEHVAHHAILAQRRRILAGVEQRAVVVRPLKRRRDVRGGIGEDLAGGKLFDVEHELASPDGVVDPRDVMAVVRHVPARELIERVTAGELVAVEHDLLGVVAVAPHHDRLLLAGLELHVREVAVLEHRDARVVLLDVRAHLGEQLVLELRDRREPRRRVRVLGREVREHRRILARVVAQPVIRILAITVRRRDRVRPSLGGRRAVRLRGLDRDRRAGGTTACSYHDDQRPEHGAVVPRSSAAGGLLPGRDAR